VRNLNVWFESNHALKDVSIDIEANEITAIIGPSGCGKSTFIRCLNRMNDIIPKCTITGSVKVDEEYVYAPRPEPKARKVAANGGEAQAKAHDEGKEVASAMRKKRLTSFWPKMGKGNEGRVGGTTDASPPEVSGKKVTEDEVDEVEVRRRIGMVFQKPNPFPKSIQENIAYAPRLHGTDESKGPGKADGKVGTKHRKLSKKELDDLVEWSLKRAALWEEVRDRLNKSAYGLSGGQQQRLCIARALAIRPEVLLLDEPCSALDPIATAKIEDLLTDLKKDYTVVIVTHNMQQAARVSDKTAYFYMGELIEYGETEQIFEKPVKELTEKYITGRMG